MLRYVVLLTVNCGKILVIKQIDAQTLVLLNVYYIPLHVSSTLVLIIIRSKLCYAATGVFTPIGGRLVHRLKLIFINCNWVVTRRQWLLYMYTKYEIGY